MTVTSFIFVIRLGKARKLSGTNRRFQSILQRRGLKLINPRKFLVLQTLHRQETKARNFGMSARCKQTSYCFNYFRASEFCSSCKVYSRLGANVAEVGVYFSCLTTVFHHACVRYQLRYMAQSVCFPLEKYLSCLIFELNCWKHIC